MSVPEKVFLSADYAILRPTTNMDVRFEIVAAFDRHTDPYRHYMQSLTCYDLQPNHGAVVVIDGDLKIHKALTALSQCGHQAAVVSNLEIKGGMGILTVTDCLRAIVMASEGVHRVAEQTVAEFLKHNNRKSLIKCDAETSIWDAARLICMNRVHRIPVVHHDEGVDPKKSQGDLLYILSLRTVFQETVLKLSDPKLALGTHIKQATLSFKKLGTWYNLITITEDALTSEAIQLFLDRRISSVPILDKNGKIKAVLSKADVMNELIRHPANYLEVLDIKAMEIADSNPPPPLLTTTMSVFDTISMLVSSERQSLVVTDVDHKPMGVVSYSDVMDYIQNYSDVHHKTSLA
jgi:5'-AMP-activated protein kinase regulatory gamma subunit